MGLESQYELPFFYCSLDYTAMKAVICAKDAE